MEHTAFRFYQQLCLSLDTDPPGRCTSVLRHDLPILQNNKETTANPIRIEKEKQTGFSVGADVKPGDNVTLIKYTAIASSLYHERSELVEHSVAEAREAKSIGWNTLVEEHRRAWQEIWDETDVVIEGDPEAQQGIRYNIFQLYQTYRGDDPRLNIGPKGFTGEKYGGNTYWNTELCCVPFFCSPLPKRLQRTCWHIGTTSFPKPSKTPVNWVSRTVQRCFRR